MTLTAKSKKKKEENITKCKAVSIPLRLHNQKPLGSVFFVR